MILTILRHASPPRDEQHPIRMTFAPRAKSSGRKLGRKPETWIQWPRARWSGWSDLSCAPREECPISGGALARETRRCVCAPLKSARFTCLHVQDVVELLLSRADPSADRSRRSVRHVQGGVFSIEKGEKLSRGSRSRAVIHPVIRREPARVSCFRRGSQSPSQNSSSASFHLAILREARGNCTSTFGNSDCCSSRNYKWVAELRDRNCRNGIRNAPRSHAF